MKVFKNIGFLICMLLAAHAFGQLGELRIGFQLSPGVSWLSTNELGISGVGSNATASIAASGEVAFSDHWSVVTGIGLGFNRGGTLRHDVGGNFFPRSRLSENALNHGQKPLPDGTKLKYSIQYIDFPFGLKWRSGEIGPIRCYVEAPVIRASVAIQRRGSIIAGDIDVRNENISKDVVPVTISWGFGGGVEYPLDDRKSLVAGLHFDRGWNDLTVNEGWTATHNPDDNPFDPSDDYVQHREDSRVLLNTLVLRLGILF